MCRLIQIAAIGIRFAHAGAVKTQGKEPMGSDTTCGLRIRMVDRQNADPKWSSK